MGGRVCVCVLHFCSSCAPHAPRRGARALQPAAPLASLLVPPPPLRPRRVNAVLPAKNPTTPLFFFADTSGRASLTDSFVGAQDTSWVFLESFTKKESSRRPHKRQGRMSFLRPNGRRSEQNRQGRRVHTGARAVPACRRCLPPLLLRARAHTRQRVGKPILSLRDRSRC